MRQPSAPPASDTRPARALRGSCRMRAAATAAPVTVLAPAIRAARCQWPGTGPARRLRGSCGMRAAPTAAPSPTMRRPSAPLARGPDLTQAPARHAPCTDILGTRAATCGGPVTVHAPAIRAARQWHRPDPARHRHAPCPIAVASCGGPVTVQAPAIRAARQWPRPGTGPARAPHAPRTRPARAPHAPRTPLARLLRNGRPP
jgi:hypothetical protein